MRQIVGEGRRTRPEDALSYAIYIGRDVSSDGHAFLAGYGDEPSSHWLELVPREAHSAGATIEVGATADARMPGLRSSIPQVGETARHLRVSYSAYRGIPAPLTNGGLNEHGVAVRDVWSPSSERLRALTPAQQRGPTYSDLARIALERSTSARHAVTIIGELISSHGETTYGGNSHLIADADEAWVMIQFAGGRGLWAAERLGPEAIRVSRPGYILTMPADYADHPDYAGSPNLISFAVERGWYEPSSGPFNPNAVYGDGRGRSPAVVWIEEDLLPCATAHGGVSLADVFAAIRHPRLTGDTAGYGQVVPLRSVADPALRVLWHAPVGAIAAPFTPFLLGVGSIPVELARHRYLTDGEATAFIDDREEPSSLVPQRIEAARAAVITFKRLLYLVTEHHETFLAEVTPVWEAFEREQTVALTTTVDQAETLLAAGRPELVTDLLTSHCSTQALRALDLGEAMLASMEARSRLLFGLRTSRAWRGPEQLW